MVKLRASFAVDNDRIKNFGIVDPRSTQATDLFKSRLLSGDERLYLSLWASSLLSSITFEPKRKIISAEETVEQAYFVVSGTLVAMQGQDIYRLGPGSVLGLAEGVFNLPSKYSVMTATAVQARVIPLHRIDAIVAKLPREVRAVLQTIIQRILGHRHPHGSQAMAQSADQGVFQTQIYQDGEQIFQTEDLANDLYFIQSGSVEITDGQGAVIAQLSPGETFGEAAILHAGIRGASARARGHVQCTLMGTQAASDLLATYSPLLVNIVEALLLQQSMHNTLRQDGGLSGG